MSYQWNEISEKEEKEYEVKGTVTISTEEYKDLIRMCERLRTAVQKEHDDWYDAYREANDNKNKVEALQKKIDDFNAYIADKELFSSFKLWKSEKIEGYQ